MKKIAFFFLSLITIATHAKTYNIEKLAREKPNVLDRCNIQNFDVVESDTKLNSLLNVYLNQFGGLKLKDFDKGTCINSKNIKDGVFTSFFYQNAKSTVGQNLKLFVAYKESSDKILLVLRDNSMQTFILGNDLSLFDNLKYTYVSNPLFMDADRNSKLTFADLGSDKLINLQKEEANKFKANKDKIITDAQKALKNVNVKNLITNDISYKELLKSGEENNPQNITINVKVDKSVNIPINKVFLKQNINELSEITKINLKNPYSYIPRKVTVKQNVDELNIAIQYTGKNSYGADVVGWSDAIFILKNDGNYSYERMSRY